MRNTGRINWQNWGFSRKGRARKGRLHSVSKRTLENVKRTVLERET